MANTRSTRPEPWRREMLTGRQQEIWDFLVEYVDEHGYPPTVREIGEAVGLASPSTVHAHLANLERAGLLKRDPTKPRALELIGRERREREAARRDGSHALPLLGADRRRRAAARRAERRGLRRGARAARDGRLPAPRQGRLDDRRRHPRRRPRRRAAGSRTPATARSSSRSPATTSRPTRRRSRRFFRENGRVRLQPENDALEPIYAAHVQILGTVIGSVPGAADVGRVAAAPHARPGAARAPARREPRVPRLRRVRPARRGGAIALPRVRDAACAAGSSARRARRLQFDVQAG